MGRLRRGWGCRGKVKTSLEYAVRALKAMELIAAIKRNSKILQGILDEMN